jgi:cytochrome c oxidase subunit IV
VGRNTRAALYVIAMAAIIVGLDYAVFRHHFWERPAANVGIVLIFAASYARFVRRS